MAKRAAGILFPNLRQALDVRRNIMKQLLFILSIILLLDSCANQDSKSVVYVNPRLPDSTTLLIGLFPEIDANDLHIYTPNDTVAADKFQGKQISSKFYKFLKFEYNINPVLADTFYHLYSCFQYKMGDSKTGLIIRRPSQYSESAIDLYTWDNLQKKVVNVINLADAFGDEGWYFIQDAWLKDLNNDKNLDIITRRKDIDRDLDDTTKVSRTDSIFVHLNNGTSFKMANFKLDTSKLILKYWSEN